MGAKTKKQHTVHIERGAPDRILPKHFGKILTRRFFPVLSLTYISSIIGMAYKKGDLQTYILDDSTVYTLALFSAGWVSIPAVLWVILKGSHLYNRKANIWYVFCAGMMSTIVLVSFVLIPEVDLYGARIYLTATIPMMFVMYFFLVKQPLSAGIAHFMTALGITALLYGAYLCFWVGDYF